jgi:transcriptional antiterminator
MRNKLQARTKLENRQLILRALIDNQWHNYKEIREKVSVTNKTLSEHLTELKPLLDKRKNASSNRLSAQYKIKPLYALILASELVTEIGWKEIREQFLKENDFKILLEGINFIANSLLTSTLYVLANEDFRDDSEVIKLLLETFVWENYKTLTWKFTETVREYIKRAKIQSTRA